MATKALRKKSTRKKAARRKTPAASPPKLYAHASHTVDAVVFGFRGEVWGPNPAPACLNVLLIRRGEKGDEGEANVFPGWWALPGGYVKMDANETSIEAVARELKEETGFEGAYLEQLYTFDDPDRDPRGRVISIAHYALVRANDVELHAGSDAKEAAWFNIEKIPKLAFDHQDIVGMALQRLQGKVRYQPVGFELLPEKFKLSELQSLYEVILGGKIDKRNFRRKILAFDFLEPLDEYAATTKRQAQLFRFDRKAYDRLVKSGFNFEL